MRRLDELRERALSDGKRRRAENAVPFCAPFTRGATDKRVLEAMEKIDRGASF